MLLRSWQEKIINDFPTIIKRYKKFILKAPTGAGKTILASEIVERFYKSKKVVVLCHRLVLLEQLERALSKKHKVYKLSVSDEGAAFKGYDVLLSTHIRAKQVIIDAIPKADLIIVDEAHRVSPNGTGYKKILEEFEKKGKEKASLIGLTATPERRTGDQRDQLNLAFDAIIDCANIKELISEGVLVPPEYRVHFIHDLDVSGIEISSGDFPVSKLASAIIKSSMVDKAASVYSEERKNVHPAPISAWFCPDITVANATLEHVRGKGWSASIVTAQTPIGERMKLLEQHEKGEVEIMVSVGVLAEGWDNPYCNIIVHLRPTLSKVLWGQSVGRGLRSAPGKSKCIVIDVSSNWTTFGPVEELEWTLWSHRRSFMKFMNRFNWIGQQQEKNGEDEPFLLCQSQIKNDLRCSYIYRKNDYKDDTCPICNSYAAIDIYKQSNVQESLSEGALHKLFFGRVGRVYSEMNASIWGSLGSTAWKSSNTNEKVFLTFCMAFAEVSGEATDSESDYWDVALKAEAEIRKFLIKNKIQIIKNDDFHLDLIADGLMAGKIIRSLQAHYGISICGESFETSSEHEAERKYQKAIKIAERLTILGCSDKDNLPYFKASEYLSGSK